MTIRKMEEQRRRLGFSWKQLAELSGLSEEMVQKILEDGDRVDAKNCSYEALQALERVLSGEADVVRETPAAYGVGKRQGEYTLEDYYKLPEDERVELIDGVFYDMSAPTHIHQVIGGEIYQIFAQHIKRKRGQCIAAYAPLDVQLDCDDRTMVQPDVLIVCDREKFQRGVVYGAPDLVVEILSKSTRKKDSYKKLEKYENAGVREYWLVDPEKKKVIVYDLEHGEYPVIYGFEDTVPVGIFDGNCSVDFSEILEDIRFLYDKL